MHKKIQPTVLNYHCKLLSLGQNTNIRSHMEIQTYGHIWKYKHTVIYGNTNIRSYMEIQTYSHIWKYKHTVIYGNTNIRSYMEGVWKESQNSSIICLAFCFASSLPLSSTCVVVKDFPWSLNT